MKKMTMNWMWMVSVCVIGIVTVILAGTAICEVEMADWLRRGLGMVDIIALPLGTYLTIRRREEKKGEDR